MHREDDSKYLLYIEPPVSAKSEESVEDDLTNIIDRAIEKAISGGANYSDTDPHDEREHFEVDSGWRGVHVTACGKVSDNKDYLLENGMITNSLAPYYVRYYRDYILSLPTEKKKLEELVVSFLDA